MASLGGDGDLTLSQEAPWLGVGPEPQRRSLRPLPPQLPRVLKHLLGGAQG